MNSFDLLDEGWEREWDASIWNRERYLYSNEVLNLKNLTFSEAIQVEQAVCPAKRTASESNAKIDAEIDKDILDEIATYAGISSPRLLTAMREYRKKKGKNFP